MQFDPNNTAATSDPLTLIVNALPTLDAPLDASVLEDSSTTIDITLADAETDADALQLSVTSSVPTLISNDALAAGLGSIGANRTLTISPLPDAFGTATLTLTVTDGNGAVAQHMLGLTVTPVNDPPQVNYGSGRSHPVGTIGLQTFPGFATAISPGPQNETGQVVTLETVVIRNAEGVVSDVSIDPQGTLRYTLNRLCPGGGDDCADDEVDNIGAAEIEVTAVDDGGTDNGGIDRGITRRFQILVGEDIIDLIVDIERVAPLGASLSEAVANGETSATYQITVGNLGPLNASGARVAVSRQRGLLDVLWACIAPAACVPVNGEGAVDARFDLAVGQTLMLEASGEVDMSQPFVDLQVQVFAPPGIRAVFTDDDSATLIEPAGVMGVFKDGYER